MSFWPRTLKRKTVWAVFLVAVLAVCNVAILQMVLGGAENIATTTNLAGKIRMLSQRIALETLAQANSPDGDWPAVDKRYADFDAAYHALRFGGYAYGVTVRALPEKLRPALDRLEDVWGTYKDTITAIHQALGQGIAMDRSQVLDVMAASDALWAESENLINGLVEYSNALQKQALWVSLVLFGLDILLLLLGYFLVQSRVILPLQLLAHQCGEMAAGNYACKTTIESDEELNALALALNRSASHIEQLLADVAKERSAVAQMQAMFNGLAANEVAGIYMVNAAMDVIYANEHLIKMMGLDDSAAVSGGITLESLFSPVHFPEIKKRVLDRLQGRSHSARYETLAQRPDGSQFEVEIFGAAMSYQGQAAIIGMMIDISARKRSEASMRRAALVYAHTSEAMVVTDPHGIVQDLNPAFTSITGYEPHEVIGRRLNMISSGRHDRDFYQTMWASLKKTGSWSGDIYNLRKNGEEFVERLTITTSYNEDGSVNSYIGLFTDVTKLRQREATIWRQAHYDHLTQLPNRQMFQESLLCAIDESRRAEKIFALVFLDLDFFKEVNDTFGHDEGDELLRQVAARLQSCVRSTDLVARLGGDEFVLILHDIKNQEAAETVCHKILESIAKPYHLANNTVQISVSAGVTFYPDDGLDGTALLKHADLAMYAAKEKGRNQFALFEPAMEQEAQTRRLLLRDLQKGLEKQEFVLHYQPIVEMATGRTVKAEVLIRWDQPVRGRVNPADFIPLAEESGLIVPLGDWIFAQAAAQVAAWRSSIAPDFVLSVNVSPVQLLSTAPNHQLWLQTLAQGKQPGAAIVLEITERMLLESDESSDAKLATLQTAGLQLALDDFGTGYSSLSYLKRFDIDYIKIDRSFVCNLDQDPEDLALCQAIIVMAHQLGIQVVAEGVETQAQHNILLEAGCDFGQGYWYSRPVAAAEITQRLLHEHQPSDAEIF